MFHMTIIASLVTTLAFSSAALKIMADAEKALPTPRADVKTCDVLNSKSMSLNNSHIAGQ